MVDDGIAYTMVEDENGRSVSYTKDGVFHEARYDFNTGVLSYDGKCIAIAQVETEFDPQLVNSGVAPFATKYTWKLYETKNGDITSDIIDAAGWVATLASFLGAPVSNPTLKTIAAKFAARYLPTVYYTHEKYYKDPVETSRPQTGSLYKFYSDSLHKDYLGTIDLRPSI